MGHWVIYAPNLKLRFLDCWEPSQLTKDSPLDSLLLKKLIIEFEPGVLLAFDLTGNAAKNIFGRRLLQIGFAQCCKCRCLGMHFSSFSPKTRKQSEITFGFTTKKLCLLYDSEWRNNRGPFYSWTRDSLYYYLKVRKWGKKKPQITKLKLFWLNFGINWKFLYSLFFSET